MRDSGEQGAAKSGCGKTGGERGWLRGGRVVVCAVIPADTKDTHIEPARPFNCTPQSISMHTNKIKSHSEKTQKHSHCQ